MLVLGFTGLLLLAALNYYLGRSLFYPAFIFCAVWTLAIGCLLFSGGMFFPLSDETIAVFICGAVAFTLGSAFGKLPKVVPSPQPREPRKILSIAVLVLFVAFPFYVHWLINLIADNPGEFFLSATRHSLVELSGEGKFTLEYWLANTLLFFAPIVAILAWIERKGRRKRALCAVAIAFMYHILTGARAAMIQLLLSLLCIQWLTLGKLKFKAFALVVILAVAVFGSLAVLVHGSNAEDELIGYISGPLVAYDRTVREPKTVPHNITAASAFLERAHRLGMKIDLPSRQSEFVPTGPDRDDNVFTIYFAYSNVGMLVGCLLLFWESVLACLIYRAAVAGNKIAIAVYAVLFSYIAMATFSDWPLGGIETLVKLACMTAAFYYFLPLKDRLGAFLHRTAHTTELRSNSPSWPWA